MNKIFASFNRKAKAVYMATFLYAVGSLDHKLCSYGTYN